ncbi:solute carrier organic anion transporter family member 74D-like [Dermacentor albipictus]|uniref:solute carrier organic anion transporter family member 74D-like n=1 Tax=Dermacentor albipictus TaxID=60249 RepID=UPI0038FCDD85
MCTAQVRDAGADDADDASRLCGVGRFRPRALQVFARPQLFTLLYSAVSILQNAHFYYFFAIMSTLQRRYGLSSWSITVILFADSASPFFVSFLVGHYSRTVSKPLLIFGAIVALVVSCAVSALPFFLYGPGLALGVVDAASRDALDTCQAPDAVQPLPQPGCESRGMPESGVVTAVLFAANCFYGSAYSVLFISGSTYVDDSVKKKNSPLHFATVAILKLTGPTLGYSLGSLCLRYYEDPRLNPALERTDPRWVGAWWMGYVVLGVCLAATALPALFFPRYLSPPASPAATAAREEPTKKANGESSFWRSLRSLFRNPAYVFRLVYWLLASNATLGHSMMSSKYVEVQFRTSASQASFLIGPVLMVTNVLGLGIGGLALHVCRPRPRLVTLYTTLCDVVKMACLVACAFIGCEAIRLAGTVSTVSGHGSSIQTACSQNCSCITRHFQPVCDPVNQKVFFSPCHAGCTKISTAEPGEVTLDECSCFPRPPLQQEHQEADQWMPYLGLCTGGTCGNVLAFIALSSLVGFIVRTTTVGHTIVGLRCISREEKAMALGVQEGLSSIFTYIPYPILYGAVFDSACLVWEDKCGAPGVCWLYDTDRLRNAYHFLSVAILLVAVVFEVGLVYHSGRMSGFYSDAVVPASQREKIPAVVVDGSEGVALVDLQKTKSEMKGEEVEAGGGEKEDEDLLSAEDRQTSCGGCKQESKEQTSVC